MDLKTQCAAFLFQKVAAQDLILVSEQNQRHLADAALKHLELRHNSDASITLNNSLFPNTSVLEIINNDMPFLLDSALAELNERGIEPKLVAHPIIPVERDVSGKLLSFKANSKTHAKNYESLIHIHLPLIADETEQQSLINALTQTYRDVQSAVADWAAMKQRLAEAIAAYKTNPPPLHTQEITESVQFLEWLQDNHFILLGTRDYSFPDGAETAAPEEGSGLGILRDPSVKILRRGTELVSITPEVRAFLKEPVALIITKSNVKSRVHRRAHMDYIGVKLFNITGQLTGELRIAGLFTSTAYNASASTIPYLRHKVAGVFSQAGFTPESYSGRALDNVIESYPRDELFQIDQQTLFTFALDILNLSERPRIRVLSRLDRFDRFVSVMVYIPKDRYDTDVRRKVGAYLASVYEGRLSAAYPAYPEGPLSRTQYIIGRDEGKTPVIERDVLERDVTQIVRTWADGLRETLPQNSMRLFSRYSAAFSAAYKEAFTPIDSLCDIAIIEKLNPAYPRTVLFYQREGDAHNRASLKVFALGEPIALSSRVPLLEDMGFTVVNERTYRVTPDGADEATRVWLHDMMLERKNGSKLDIKALKPRVEALIMALFAHKTESDGYNALIHDAHLGWREIAMLRTYSRYLRQIKFGFGQEYLWLALNRYPHIAIYLVALFEARFNPHKRQDEEKKDEAQIIAEIDTALETVTSLDDDRILRRFRNLILATLRTNFYQLGDDGMPRSTISFKFQSSTIEGLPLPRPEFEIYMDSPRVEGLHLRFGKVARGGLRWSDRPQDFRTEILGLVKAQQVKNAVIVPVGAKGGFVPKNLPPASNREAWLKEGTESYKIFISTLLELTDNLVGEAVVPPQNTVRHDQDDPYLVVAADKGTATFSDTANAISLEKHHWLGDAFASGGSIGYDHKKMGITAKGAWEAIKRHFREINIDIQTTPFTVAGVGDMSGDVFGNGMLLSPAIKLVAAFDHRDIFLDPTPDIQKSFIERQRIFDLPRSSWQDFDKNLISKGGGIFSRSLKEIPLSTEVQAMLGLTQTKATPQEVMTAILKSNVDLLWFGGIGTYICGSNESNEQVSDKANDAIRIVGAELRAKVIGEGANLGATQLGRIEAAYAGVRLNTDAIDNSAGVNTSDVEVNIKIALQLLTNEGKLDSDARIAFLASMTDEVGSLVLRNNYLQTLSLSMTQARKLDDLPYQRQLMLGLEKDGRLDRKIEFLPNETNLTAREKMGDGLTRPELAVLLAYAKLFLHDALLASTAPDEPYFEHDLIRYFPHALRISYPKTIYTHKLRREIIATQLANSIINSCGLTVMARLFNGHNLDVAKLDAERLAKSFCLVRDAFELDEIHTGLDALDNALSGDMQLQLYTDVQNTTLELLSWFLQEADFADDLEIHIKRFAAGFMSIKAALNDKIKASIQAKSESLITLGLPQMLANRIADLQLLNNVPDIIRVCDLTGRSEADVTAVFMASDEALQFSILQIQGNSLRPTDRFDGQVRDMAVKRIMRSHRALTIMVLKFGAGYEDFATQHAGQIEPVKATITEMLQLGMSVSKLTIAAGLLSDLETM